MPTPLDHIGLYKELTNRAKESYSANHLRSRLITSIDQINVLLNEIRVHFRHFSDHSINHSFRILHNINSILTDNQLKKDKNNDNVITDLDLFMLISVALVHDIGMVVSEQEILDLQDDEKFKSFLKVTEPELNENSELTNLAYGINRILISEFYRKNHAQRAFELIVNEDFLPKSLTEGCGKLKVWLGKISKAHGCSRNEVYDFEKYPDKVDVQLPGGIVERFNPRFIAICLRLGDLLDIGTARACPILRNLSDPLPYLSEHHWDQYKDIEIINLAPNSEITISGTCPSQESERVLREWISWLEEEASSSIAIQNQDKTKYQLKLGRISYKVEPQKKNGSPIYEFLEYRFNLDEKVVFERLFGKSIYGRNDLVFRELIQNCIDAQRAHIAHLCSKDIDNWSQLQAENKAHLFKERLEFYSKDFPIEISIWEDTDLIGNNHTWIKFTDSGIGMTRDVIEKYFLKVGRSRWGSDSNLSELGIGNIGIGKFGIGFISSFLVADNIVISTKSNLPDQTGIKATVYGWDGYLATETLDNCKNGTSISLRLKSKWFKDEIELSKNISQLIPDPDFPIVLKSGDTEIQIPYLDIEANNENIGEFKYDDYGSKIILRLNHSNNQSIYKGCPEVIEEISNSKRDFVLVQDGIVISEVPLPQNKDLESLLLNRFNIVLCLKGNSRVGLDLSRNTIEQGNHLFWEETIGKLWDKICSSFGTNNISKYIVRRYVDERYLWDYSSPMILVKKDKPIYKGIESAKSEEAIVFSETLLKSKNHVNDKIPCYMLPSLDMNELITSIDGSQEMEDLKIYAESFDDDDGFNRYRVKRKNYFYRSESSYHFDTGIEWFKLQKKRTRLDKEFNRLSETFKFVWKDEDYGICLSKKFKEGAFIVNELLGFELTDDRLYLIEPSQSRLTLVPIYFDWKGLKHKAKEGGLSIADLYLFLIFNIYSSFDYISNYKPKKMSSKFEKFGNVMDNKFYKYIETYKRNDKNIGNNDISSDLLLNINMDEYGHLFKGVAKEVDLHEAVCSWEQF